jgi:hypothetical protein
MVLEAREDEIKSKLHHRPWAQSLLARNMAEIYQSTSRRCSRPSPLARSMTKPKSPK